MNRIYSLRYSTVARGFIAVPEFARKCVCQIAGRSPLNAALLLSLLGSSSLVEASIVSSNIGYQQYRDFAENKGAFKPGATNISIYNKKGEQIATLNKTPMLDFSSVDSGIGVATLINPQYIVSVKHNSGYQTVGFGNGENQYNIVARNEHDSIDFHAPRLNKLVTEVAPTAVSGASQEEILDPSRFTVFYRVGSGTQYIQDDDGTLTEISGAYNYLTGGLLPASYYSHGGLSGIQVNMGGNINDYGVMASRPRPGDSGSPVFGWDAANKKWVLVAVHAANGGGVTSIEKLIPGAFISQVFSDDSDAPIRFDASAGHELSWTFDGSRGIGALTQGASVYSMHGQQGADLNAGKNLVFLGQAGLIDLKNSVSQGAGSLTFRNDYRVTASTGSTWSGAGIIVDKDASVYWQVNGVKGDNLHKIGEGTLVIQGEGVNEGGLKVGDGTVVLQQQTDKDGRVQAFDSVNIASGRPTVVLSDNRQVQPDNISWGYHGGTLDINGNSLTFHRLRAADYGAVLANNAEVRATVAMDYTLSPGNVALNSWSGSRQGTVGSLYEYRNPYANTTDYFILKTNSYGYFPTDQRSSDTWEYLGNNLVDAQKQVAERENAQGYLYHGQLKGNLNVSNVVAPGSSGKLVLDGSADISGSFTQENGRLTLQGHPVIHAYNDRAIADKLAATGDTSVRTQPTSFDQEDWENRSFTLGRLVLKNTDFGLGRNATLNTAIDASNSVVTLGDDRVFIDQKDGAGTDFRLSEGISAARNQAERSVFNGSAALSGNSQLNIVNALFNGDITGYSGTHVQLAQGGIWNMTQDSSLDVLQSRDGVLSLVTARWKPKTLTVNTLDASNLRIGLGVNTSDNASDRIDILNQAKGEHNILDMSYLFDQTVQLTNDLTLASAPAGTSHGYFSFASLNRGFTVYTPDTQIVEKDGRVQWQLKHSAILESADSATTPAGDGSNGASGSAGNGAGGSSSGNGVGDPPSGSGAGGSSSGNGAGGSSSGSGAGGSSSGNGAGGSSSGNGAGGSSSGNGAGGSSSGSGTGGSSSGSGAGGSSSVSGAGGSSSGNGAGGSSSGSGAGGSSSGNGAGGSSSGSGAGGSSSGSGAGGSSSGSGAGGSSSGSGAGDPPSGSGAGGSSSGNISTPVNGEHLFRKEDNTALLKKARSMFAAREYILSDHVDHWEQIIDYTDAQSGAWAMTGYSHGGYDAYSVRQNGLDFGFRKHGDSGEFWGTAVELYDGNSSATGFRDDYRVWGVSLFAGQTLASGLFVDGSAGYRQLSETFSVQGDLNDLSGNVKSHIATAGARIGWRIDLKDADIAITPSVSVNGARIDGNYLQGNGRSAELHAGGALWLKAGVMVEKDFGILSIKSGLSRNITLNEMPGITLTDNWRARHYNAERADRYTASVGLDGRVTEKLHVQLTLNSSFDGDFKTDGEGGLGIRYSF
ncbi:MULTISPECIES: S6 family peptidase [Edwardsiella]|uniref:Autotransporter outer membrane beta-barrel domain-containing protein n=4 Tax=Edwardsiella anguillarum TaxID=1821960 RepID=A0ABY8SET0_9GAMM|nr:MULTISPECIES: S6 family peptidase [Edwardsiella]AKR78875.2 autotransporter outer membrane beta-barrel domain-containing protein [Edwardsiella sp. LADL05-105]UOU78760.1 autotransporter outer membrane beta-barrel domain-containing protein [Edwardsiella anguillarum]WHP83476.1 autotransporter outer membrane beta-barrel domain-containing protein [Edwardsiella anguillarum]WHP87268.1 autotransporter outer membrane beta-barrel domain-containing protein [Edwardsiella anguillarum]WHP91067.1 autotrans